MEGNGAVGGAPRRSVTSMRLILSLVTALLVGMAVVGVGTVALHDARQTLTREIQTRLLLEARALANIGADVLLQEFPELTLTPVIREMRSSRPELSLVAVLDRDGLIRGSDDARQLGRPFTGLEGARPETAVAAPAPGEQLLGDERNIVAVVPIRHVGGHELGRAVVALRRDYLESLLAAARRRLLLLSALMLAVGLGVSVLVMTLLLRPVRALREGLERIGHGDLDTPMTVRDRTELGLLADTVNDMAARIKASQQAMLEKERLDHEMELAHAIQQSLMPDHALRVGPYAIAGSYQAAAEVGGDYYDVFALPRGRIGVLLADVAGKGLAGCLVTSMLAVLVRTLRDAHDSPSDLLRALEQGLVDSLAPGVFITIFYGILDPARDELIFASAAHNPLLVYRAADGRVEQYRTRGLPLGAIRGGQFAASLHDETIRLAPGDVVLQYTDGLNEAPAATDGEEFGFERLAELLREGAGRDVSELLGTIQQRVCAWQGGAGQMDDQTLLAIAHVGRTDAAAPRTEAVLSWLRNHTAEDIEEILADAPHLSLPAELPALARIGDWLRGLPGTQHLPSRQLDLLEHGVYELCANIAEHGYPGEATGEIDLWWQPPGEVPLDGHLLVRDQGRVFDLGDWPEPDLDDPEVRARGRGLGIMMLKTLLDATMYLPNTGLGNLNLLRFDPLLEPEPVEAIRA